jgi:hypothetical protein
MTILPPQNFDRLLHQALRDEQVLRGRFSPLGDLPHLRLEARRESGRVDDRRRIVVDALFHLLASSLEPGSPVQAI